MTLSRGSVSDLPFSVSKETLGAGLSRDCALSGTDSHKRFARIDSRESFAVETPIFIAHQADSPESLKFPIRANHPIRANRANNRFAQITPLRPFGAGLLPDLRAYQGQAQDFFSALFLPKTQENKQKRPEKWHLLFSARKPGCTPTLVIFPSDPPSRTGGILFREYCLGEESSLSLTEFYGKLGEFCEKNSASSLWHTNNRLRGTH